MNGIESGVDVEFRSIREYVPRSVEEDHGYLGFVLINLANNIAI